MELLSSIPNVIWSAVIASFLTFLGVMWTNKGSNERLRMQLAHERDRYQSEQKINLKKEVFLEAASALSKSLSAITKLSNMNSSVEEISNDISSASSDLSKIYAIANESTVKSYVEFSGELGDTFLMLLKDRGHLDSVKQKIEMLESQRDRALQEQDRIIAIMKELNLQGASDKRTWDYLNKSFEDESKYADEVQNEINQLLEVNNPKHKEFAVKCIENYARLSVLLTPVILAVRKELSELDDSDEIVEVIELSMSRMKRSFEEFVASV